MCRRNLMYAYIRFLLLIYSGVRFFLQCIKLRHYFTQDSLIAVYY